MVERWNIAWSIGCTCLALLRFRRIEFSISLFHLPMRLAYAGEILFYALCLQSRSVA